MFVAGSHEDVGAWLVGGYSVAVVVLGVLGFHLTSRLLQRGRRLAAWLQSACSLAGAIGLAVFGWDGSGYRRVLYPGTCEDWAAGREFSVWAFPTSPVGVDLAWLEALLILPYVVMVLRWGRRPPG